jgi:hypothetical protein
LEIYLLIKDNKVLNVYQQEKDAFKWLDDNLDHEKGLFHIETHILK